MKVRSRLSVQTGRLALEWLGRAVAEHVPAAMMMNVDPAFESLRADRRFAELLVEVGLQEQRG